MTSLFLAVVKCVSLTFGHYITLLDNVFDTVAEVLLLFSSQLVTEYQSKVEFFGRIKTKNNNLGLKVVI